MTPVMRACVNPKYRRVFVVMFSQGGKTQGFFNVIGQRFDDDPVPILYIGPTRNNALNVIEPKIDDMLRSTPDLWRKTLKGKKYTTTKKLIGGAALRLAWAGSTSEVKSDSAFYVIVDELDEIPPDVKGQGDIIEKADARHASYPDGKTLSASSPTEGNISSYIHPDTGLEHWEVAEPEAVRSASWRWWQQGTKHEWAVPCPECGEYFIPRFKNLWWPEGCTPEQAEKEARLTCGANGCLIHTKHKDWMNARGIEVAPGQSVSPDRVVTGPEPVELDFSLWVSGLMSYSAKRTFGYLAYRWLSAVRSGDKERIKGVLNHEFGECFKISGDAPDWQELLKLRGDYLSDTVPSGVLVLTCFVDVQKDRLYYAIRGWGYRMESWLIRADELLGDTDQDEVWEDLQALLDDEYDGFRIKLMLVDSGFNPNGKEKKPKNKIYEFCRNNMGRVKPTKGYGEQEKPLKASKIDVTIRGKVVKKGLTLWKIDTDFFKSWLMSRLRFEPDQPGAFHLCSDVTDDYCMQVTAEQRVVKPSGAVKWLQVRKDNHLGDCETGNVVAAYMLQLHRLRAPKDEPEMADAMPAVAKAKQDQPRQEKAPSPAPRSNTKARRKRVVRSKFMG